VTAEKSEDETYSLIFRSLKHPIRRKVLRTLAHKELTFSEILEAISIDSGHLSYHLDSLGELLTRSAEGRYKLSAAGEAAARLMGGVEEEQASDESLHRMRSHVPKELPPSNWYWILALAIIGSIILSAIFVLTLLNLSVDAFTITPFVVFWFSLVCVFVFYVGFRKRHFGYFSITFGILGIILILLASLIQVPFYRSETVRTDYFKDQTPYLHELVSGQKAANKNGSLQVITLQSNETKTYIKEWSYWERDLNQSILYIDFSATGPITLQLTEISSWHTSTNVFMTVKNNFQSLSLQDGMFESVFWTFPRGYFFGLGFAFTNPNDHAIDFSFKVTQRFFEATERRTLVTYATPLGPYYIYTGILFVCISVVLDGYSYRPSKPKTPAKLNASGPAK
jgi:DNA-binding transcriptional ArsR family regulator